MIIVIITSDSNLCTFFETLEPKLHIEVEDVKNAWSLPFILSAPFPIVALGHGLSLWSLTWSLHRGSPSYHYFFHIPTHAPMKLSQPRGPQVRWDTPSSTSRQRRCSSAPAEV